MNNATKAVKALRSLFARARKEGYIDEVWAIATALRGPDAEVIVDSKQKITAPIRGFVVTERTFNHTWRPIVNESMAFQMEVVGEVEGIYEGSNNHFIEHAFEAIRTLEQVEKELL